jgi:hypothetical protein
MILIVAILKCSLPQIYITPASSFTDLPYYSSSSWLGHFPWLTISEKNQVNITTTMQQNFHPHYSMKRRLAEGYSSP